MKIEPRKFLFMGAAALFAIAAVFAWWRGSQDLAGDAPAAADRRVLYWYDPMVPDQHFDKPGKSPFMDMQLVPRYADDEATPGVAVSPVTQRSLAIRTVAVERGQLGGETTVPGTIAWDPQLERIVSARTELIVDRLHVKVPFTAVRPGEALASVIAPAWSSALAEAQAITQGRDEALPGLEAAALARLRALGIPPGTRLGDDGRIVLTAPIRGVVSEIGVREGEVAPVGTILFRVNGTGRVWLLAAVPQGDASGIAAGTAVVADVDGVPARFEGRVATLLPTIDAASRTRVARIVLDNPAGLLAAGQLSRVSLRTGAGAASLLVPSDAVIGSGGQAHVIVRRGESHFMPLAVHIGRSRDGRTEVLHGLEGGEQVVVAGQFLLDSEASLSGALARLGDHGAHP
ncbi:MAG: efflux RND transporter periplasmic adaptor subunit [Steroidobacteraceae bacterium]